MKSKWKKGNNSGRSKKINVPLLNIIGGNDDLVSPKSSILINDMVSNKDKETIEFPSGHFELYISEDAHLNIRPTVVDWLQSRSDTQSR
ncbi:MAG TPA: hypothetical protein VFT71_02830 [Candidatus Nitrosocosmicus sp.]|nr:hypothetical protein [Candidatus Nitrosocosmicus sp.]